MQKFFFRQLNRARGGCGDCVLIHLDRVYDALSLVKSFPHVAKASPRTLRAYVVKQKAYRLDAFTESGDEVFGVVSIDVYGLDEIDFDLHVHEDFVSWHRGPYFTYSVTKSQLEEIVGCREFQTIVPMSDNGFVCLKSSDRDACRRAIDTWRECRKRDPSVRRLTVEVPDVFVTDKDAMMSSTIDVGTDSLVFCVDNRVSAPIRHSHFFGGAS